MFFSISSGIFAYIVCKEGLDQVRLAAGGSGRFRNLVENAAGKKGASNVALSLMFLSFSTRGKKRAHRLFFGHASFFEE